MNSASIIYPANDPTKRGGKEEGYSFDAVVDPVSSMSREMQQYAIDSAILSIIKHSSNKYEMAKYIKTEFDKKYGQHWCCIVGSEFRAFFTYQDNCYTVFKIKDFKFILYKEL
jgi:dynein light chain LC8-type